MDEVCFHSSHSLKDKRPRYSVRQKTAEVSIALLSRMPHRDPKSIEHQAVSSINFCLSEIAIEGKKYKGHFNFDNLKNYYLYVKSSF